MNKLLLLKLLCTFVHAERQAKNVNGDSEKSSTKNIIDLAAAAGIVPPTNSWNPNAATKTFHSPTAVYETSNDNWVPSPTAPSLNILNQAAEGDLHGAIPRNNLVYFDISRKGFNFGAEIDDCMECADCRGKNIYGNAPCDVNSFKQGKSCCDAKPLMKGFNCEGGRYSDYDHYPCVENNHHVQARPFDHADQPYLRVTPQLAVKKSTRTITETATSTSLQVETNYRTRTVTERDLLTHTHIFNPVETLTYVVYRTVYEYPASTIDFDHVRAPHATAAHKQQQQPQQPHNWD